MLIIVCHLWLDTRCWIHHKWQTRTNIECQVTSDRLWPTLGVKSQVTDYDQHRTSGHKWQTMISIGRHVTSGRLWKTSCVRSRVTDYYQPSGVKSRVTEYYQHLVSSHEWQTMTNIVCQVTSDRLCPTLSVKWRVTAYYQHRGSSQERKTMTNIGCQVTVTWPPMLVSLSLVTWHSMLVIVCHLWLDTQCWS
jgi:hypothetical protein